MVISQPDDKTGNNDSEIVRTIAHNMDEHAHQSEIKIPLWLGFGIERVLVADVLFQ